MVAAMARNGFTVKVVTVDIIDQHETQKIMPTLDCNKSRVKTVVLTCFCYS
jgi:hypothetical protein